MPAQDVLVIGLGYVGLPLAVQAARARFRVTGYDTSAEIASGLMAGRSHVDDVTDAEVAGLIGQGFRATTAEAEIGPQDVIVICVPTPLSAADGPDLSAVRAAAQTAGRLLRPGTLVSLESTTYPGTTDEVVRPLLEKASGLSAGFGFSLAFSPERIDPGNSEFGLANTPKIVGGVTPSCADAAVSFYQRICEEVVRAKSAREAEMAKLLENTYRHVNIALVNEMAIFCRELDVDLWDAIRCAATKPFGFQPFYPGPGVGGHCIPIDPNYLSYKVRTLGYPFRFVELAQEINGRMPGYVTERAAELLNRNAQPVNGARVLLLGVTYKRDIADQRESPARPIAHRLRARGAAVAYHEVTYVAPVDPQDFYPERTWPSLRLKAVPRASGRRRTGAILAARSALAQHAADADLLLIHDPELLLALPARRRRPPVIWDVHEDTAAALNTKPWLPRPLRPPAAVAVHTAERMAERYVHLILAERGYVARFARPHPVVPNTTYVPDVPAPPGDDRRVVYVGHLSPDRGTADMIELARLVRPRGITVELIGPADARARAQIEPAQAAGLLRWRGFVPNDQAMPILDGALAGLSLLHDEPNFRHSLPTKVVEYMARGVPVVTTPLSAAAELGSGHECGFVVPFGDPQAAADAVLGLDRDISLRAKIGRRGHEAARRSLGWPADAREFVTQLESWAKEKSPARHFPISRS